MEDKLVKKYKHILLLNLIILILSTLVDIFLFVYVLLDLIKNPETLVKYTEIVSFVLIFVGLIFIINQTLKHIIRGKSETIKYAK